MSAVASYTARSPWPPYIGADRKPDGRKYHVDYCFMPLDWCSHLREVEVGEFDAWIGKGLSDHVPLVVDVDVPVAQAQKSTKPGRAVRTDLDGYPPLR